MCIIASRGVGSHLTGCLEAWVWSSELPRAVTILAILAFPMVSMLT